MGAGGLGPGAHRPAGDGGGVRGAAAERGHGHRHGAGKLPYDRSLGSRFYLWDREEEHALERAVALANEGLLSLPGVQAVSAQETEDGVVFTLQTPLGEGSVTVWKATKGS